MAGMDRWFIGGGAEHTPESARRLVYASTSGAEGVGGIGDLKVVPLSVPGQGVRVLTGSALIRSKYQGGETQTYMGTAYQEQQVATVPTGSTPSSGRSDMIVMRVEDPFAAGSPWDEPSEGDIATADYVHIRVISGVPSTAVKLSDIPGHANDTAIPLARIDLPASTGTVNAAHIVDLRHVAQPRERVTLRTTAATGGTSSLTSGTPQEWPPVSNGALAVDIPEWATGLALVLTISGAYVPAGGAAGGMGGAIWAKLGTGAAPGGLIVGVTPWDVDEASNGYTVVHVSPGVVTIPEALRGQRVSVVPVGVAAYGTGKTYTANGNTTVTVQAVFTEGAA